MKKTRNGLALRENQQVVPAATTRHVDETDTPAWLELHRDEVEAAGFEIDAESTALTNEEDPHSAKVFDASIKGNNDRFAHRFVRR